MEEIEYIHNLEKQYQGFEINGVLLNNHVNIKQIPLNAKMTYNSFAEHVWQCVGEFVRLTSQKTSFCEFFFDFALEKFGGKKDLVTCFFQDTLSILTYNESEENKYMSILLVKKGKPNLVSPRTVNLIWRLRARFLERTSETVDYFASLNGFFLKFEQLPDFLSVLDDYKYGNKELVLSVCENFKMTVKGVSMIDINNAIFIVLEIFRNYYLYAITEPKPFVPKTRNVNAYVYRMLNKQRGDFFHHEIHIQRLSKTRCNSQRKRR
jgi:hypothetical protein